MVINLTSRSFIATVALRTGSTLNSCPASLSRTCGNKTVKMSEKVIRDWGYYRVLHEVSKAVKVKELTVEPGKSLSMQRHFSRNELWFVAEGIATLHTLENDEVKHLGDFGFSQTIFIKYEDWHQLSNTQDYDLKIIEIQYGEDCIEEDIERRSCG